MNIPAIRGKIGNTIYYSANFTFQQINDLVKKVEGEIYTSAPLKERIQRSLTDNSGKIKQYILDRNDRFFNALSEGGEVEMPMEDQFWGDYFGSFRDRFGIHWMINHNDSVQI